MDTAPEIDLIAPLGGAEGPYCPVETTIHVIGGRWKPLILFYLGSGPQRFNGLRRLIPQVTQRMLTQHLRELEADGVISRTVHAVVPPHVEYALTPLGESLTPILTEMAAWGAAYEARAQQAGRTRSGLDGPV